MKSLNGHILFWLIVLPILLVGEDPEVNKIRSNCSSTLALKAGYMKADTSFYDLSTEGAKVSFFWNSVGQLKVIEATIFGESGNVEFNICCKDSSPVLITRIEQRYLVPCSFRLMRSEELSAMGISEEDFEKRETIGNQFYFSGGEMIHWIDNDGIIRTEADAKWSQNEAYCLESFMQFYKRRVSS